MRIEIYMDGHLQYKELITLIDVSDEVDLVIRSNLREQNIRLEYARFIERIPKIDGDPFIDIYVVLPSKANT